MTLSQHDENETWEATQFAVEIRSQVFPQKLHTIQRSHSSKGNKASKLTSSQNILDFQDLFKCMEMFDKFIRTAVVSANQHTSWFQEICLNWRQSPISSAFLLPCTPSYPRVVVPLLPECPGQCGFLWEGVYCTKLVVCVWLIVFFFKHVRSNFWHNRWANCTCLDLAETFPEVAENHWSKIILKSTCCWLGAKEAPCCGNGRTANLPLTSCQSCRFCHLALGAGSMQVGFVGLGAKLQTRSWEVEGKFLFKLYKHWSKCLLQSLLYLFYSISSQFLGFLRVKGEAWNCEELLRGAMGYHMAGHMAKCHGHQCLVWNRTEAKAGRLDDMLSSQSLLLSTKNARPFNTPRSLAPAQWGSLSS